MKNIGGVPVLFLRKSSDGGLYLYKASSKYSGRYPSYRADTVFIKKNFKGPSFRKKNVGGVSVLVLCTSSDDGLYLYQIS